MKFWNWKSRKITNQETGEETSERVLFLNGAISEVSWFDDEVTPQLFKDELNAGTGDITVWINSPGGDCFAAAQIYNMLIDYKGDVTVMIDGLAASAASVVAMAGTKVVMSPVAMMMIHNPSTMAWGDKDEMKKAIDILDAVKDSIMNAYEIKTGLNRVKLSKLMDDETWMDSTKALELGFIDEIWEKARFEDYTVPEVTMMYSAAAATNSLKERIAAKCHINTPEENTKDNAAVENEPKNTAAGGCSADLLRDRLNFIKKFI